LGNGVKLQSNHGEGHLRFHHVLVTGASGFLGHPLVERLIEAGYKVTAVGLRHKESPFVSAVDYHCVDLADCSSSLQFLLPWRWDAVVNLAGPLPSKQVSWPEDCRILHQHTNIALNICSAVNPLWVGRFIHASSMTVYGCPEYLPVDEAHPRKPSTAYGMAKCLVEDIVLNATQYKKLDCWLLRFPGLFSETRRSGALYNFMQAAACGRPIVISTSEPTPWDVLHRDDAVEAIMRTLVSEGRNPGPINISYGSPIELVTMAEMIAALGRPRVAVENSYGVRHPVFQMSIEKTRGLFDWPPVSLQSRITSLWEALSGQVGSGADSPGAFRR
jgi:UDP-glucose 4-epimerase